MIPLPPPDGLHTWPEKLTNYRVGETDKWWAVGIFWPDLDPGYIARLPEDGSTIILEASPLDDIIYLGSLSQVMQYRAKLPRDEPWLVLNIGDYLRLDAEENPSFYPPNIKPPSKPESAEAIEALRQRHKTYQTEEWH